MNNSIKTTISNQNKAKECQRLLEHQDLNNKLLTTVIISLEIFLIQAQN